MTEGEGGVLEERAEGDKEETKRGEERPRSSKRPRANEEQRSSEHQQQ